MSDTIIRLSKVVQSRIKRHTGRLIPFSEIKTKLETEINRVDSNVLTKEEEKNLADVVSLYFINMLTEVEQLNKSFYDPKQNEISKPKTIEDFKRDATIKFYRVKFESEIYGKKIKKQQWERIVETLSEIGLVSETGVISEIHLGMVARIMKVKSNLATREVIKGYIKMLGEISKDEQILGVTIWYKAIELADKYKSGQFLDGKPTAQTLYSWFNRSGLKYKGHNVYTPEQAMEVYLRAMF